MAINQDAPKERKAAKIAIAVVVLAVAATVLVWNYGMPGFLTPSPGTPQAYFYDLETDKVFAAPVQPPPIVAPSGAKAADGRGTGVLAMVFSCGACDKESERVVTYLQTNKMAPHTPRMNSPGLGSANRALAQNNPLVASPEAKDKWFDKTTKDGIQVQQNGLPKCPDDKPPQACYPPGLRTDGK